VTVRTSGAGGACAPLRGIEALRGKPSTLSRALQHFARDFPRRRTRFAVSLK